MNIHDKQIADIDRQIADLLAKKRLVEYEKHRIHSNNKVNDYLKTYSGQKLLQKYKLDHISKWEILGEDPNCDLAGTHINPHLAYVHGTLEKAIGFAVEYEGFYTWGSGGEIKEIKERNIIEL
jgi:hypothetical protein